MEIVVTETPYVPVRFQVRKILNVSLHALKWADALGIMEEWVAGNTPHQVSVVNAHSIIMARQDPDFLRAIEDSDLILPDSTPVVWISRLLGQALPERLAGPDFCEAICGLAEKKGYSVFFLGSSAEVLNKIQTQLRTKFPRLNIAGVYSPPMTKEFSEQESEAMISAVNAAKPDILWTGLTAPKQEKWIHRYLPRLHCKAAVGIGAAFDFMAGTRKRAPRWIQSLGLEWLYRFLQEPRRLWRRYVVSNGIFLGLTAVEFLRRCFDKTIRPVLNFILRCYLKIIRASFRMDEKNYPYFWHGYNMTWRNERCVEVAVAQEVLEEFRGKRILEVGNVLRHYLPTHHDVVDKYEKDPAVIRQDVVDFNPESPYDAIISLSTLEHVGWDEEQKDPEKISRAVDHLLHRCLAPGGKMLVTFPYAYNPELDEKVRTGRIRFDRIHFLRRLGKFCDWKEVPFEQLQDVRYDSPFPLANGLVVGIFEKNAAGKSKR